MLIYFRSTIEIAKEGKCRMNYTFKNRIQMQKCKIQFHQAIEFSLKTLYFDENFSRVGARLNTF